MEQTQMDVQDTAAPVASVETTASDDTGALLDGLAKQAALDALPADPTPAEDRPRDAQGRFIKASGEAEDGDEGAEDAATVNEGSPPSDASEDAPTPTENGAVQVPVVQGRELATQFQLLDPTGGELAIPELTIRFTANGKERAEPLDRVVKFAQMGVYNHDREVKFAAVEQQAREAEAAKLEAAQKAEQYERVVLQLLADPNAYLAAQQEYERSQTPEAEAERWRQEAERARQEAEQVRIATQGQAFFEGELAPTVDALADALPGVSSDELAAKLLLLVEPHRVNGVVPPARYEAVRAAVLNDLVPWAKYLHEVRQAERDAQVTPIRAEADKARQEAESLRVKAQQAKRLVGKATQPVGRAAPDVPSKKRVADTVDDRLDDALSTALQMTFQRAG